MSILVNEWVIMQDRIRRRSLARSFRESSKVLPNYIEAVTRTDRVTQQNASQTGEILAEMATFKLAMRLCPAEWRAA